MPFHLPQKQCDRKDCRGGGVGNDPRKIGPDIAEITFADGLLDPYRMAERQELGGLLKRAAHEVEVKPYAGQPGREVSQQRTAHAADLLYVEHASAQKAESYEKHRGRNQDQHRPQYVYRDIHAKYKCGYEANCRLSERNGQYRQRVAEDEVRGREWRRVKPLQKRAFAVLCNERRGEKRHE